jgi:long-subunit acyl-CoA synthetase (AMP-forming)
MRPMSNALCICSLQGENKQYELPVKKKEDICTIMYTSGTTGDPKGVLISNDSIVTLIAGVKRLLESVKESVIFFFSYILGMS